MYVDSPGPNKDSFDINIKDKINVIILAFFTHVSELINSSPVVPPYSYDALGDFEN